MNRISISEAWSHATGFFSGQQRDHAIVLIGFGIVAPLLMTLLSGGLSTVQAQLAGASPLAQLGALTVVTGLVNYVLQTGSYFTSWRIGLAPGRDSLWSALTFGWVASLVALLVMLVIALIGGIVGALLFGASLIPLLTGAAAGRGIVDPAALGRELADPAALGGLALGMLLSFLLLLWLAARLCCTGPAMAARGSWNPLTALAESWRMTAASQFRLMGYFVLVGVVVMVVAMVLGLIGVGAVYGVGANSGGAILAIMIVSALVSIPYAYLWVGVPAGIYRALSQGAEAEVFA